MILAGKQGYRWKGNEIRVIDGNIVSLPRTTSYIIVPAEFAPGKDYELIIDGCKKGGTGQIKLSCDELPELNSTGYIKTKDFNDCKIKIRPEVDYITSVTLRISREPKLSGNILIGSVSCVEKDKPPTQDQLSENERQLKLSIQNKLGTEQKIAQKREKELLAMSEITGIPVKIGGQGYRWKGYKLRTTYKFGTTCVKLPSQESVVMIPADVKPNTRYKVILEAAKETGDGKLLVNFFGGPKADGVHVPTVIAQTKLRHYEIYVLTPDAPPNLTMYLRVFRPNGSKGNVFIKTLEYVAMKKHEDGSPRPRLPKPKPKPKPKRKPNVSKVINKGELKLRENEIMKFKPYDVATDNRRAVENVLIRDEKQVPKVSIITPTRDGRVLLEECYKALDKNTAYPNWEWIVGDSNSTDGSVEYLKKLGDSRVKIIERNTTDGSFSSINNELAQHATGKYLLFLNNDTEPQSFWLYEMMSKIAHDPEIGIVGARLMYNEDKVQHAGIVFVPNGPANLGKELLKMMPKDYELEDRYFQAVTGACMLMRKKDFEAVGGFDLKYHFCYEDVDLCLKFKEKLDKRVYYAANAVLYHKESSTQKKHKTAGDAQRSGIAYFKNKWMSKVDIDLAKYKSKPNFNKVQIDVSFVTCVNHLPQYNNYVLGSLFKTKSKKKYEIIPILNFGNPYSAAEALNLGIKRARSNIVVLCHQDVIFYQEWIDTLFERIREIEKEDKRWGVLGTAGITEKDITIGVVHNIRGGLQWQSTKKHPFYPVQTVDEHCMIIRKDSGLRFDEKNFTGFHFYGPDICLLALDKRMQNYGILCPLVHNSGGGSLESGRQEFMRLLNTLADKWRKKFKRIRTPTSSIKSKSVRTFVKFRKK